MQILHLLLVQLEHVCPITIGTTVKLSLSFYDKLHDFDYATGDFQVYEKVNLRENHITKFVDDSALVTENAIRVFAISDQPLAAAARPSIEWVMTYYYTDM